MIHFVLERSCEESGGIVLMFPSVSSQPFDDGTGGAHDRCVESRDAQTALFFQLRAFTLDEHAERGVWQVEYVMLVDNAGNSRQYGPDALAAQGFSISIVVR